MGGVLWIECERGVWFIGQTYLETFPLLLLMLVLLLHFRLYGLMTGQVVLPGVEVLCCIGDGGDVVSTDSIWLWVTNAVASVSVLKLWCIAPG